MVNGKALVQHALYQRLMLRQAVKALKPGGRLVFSTCTLNPDENEGNTAWALQELGLDLVDLRSDALLASLGAPGIVGGGARGGLSAQDCAKVLRFNPGDPCAVVPIAGEASEAGESGGRAVEVDLCPGFYMACFEKP
jgi:16S rRNA C967 or C1407 C5-methylase (RsmB/RsmF family)